MRSPSILNMSMLFPSVWGNQGGFKEESRNSRRNQASWTHLSRFLGGFKETEGCCKETCALPRALRLTYLGPGSSRWWGSARRRLAAPGVACRGSWRWDR